MQILGVILARGRSEGLPGKHLLPLLGKPVLQYTIEHARQSKLLSRIVVSTDCAKIRKLAESLFVETVARPPALATSTASVQDAMLHAMKTVESRSAFRADALVVLYGNTPVRGEGVIDRAIARWRETKCDSVRTFCPVGKWHPAWMAKLGGERGDRVEPLQSGSIDSRHNLSKVFLHDGAAVVVSRESLLRGETNPGDPHAFFGDDRRAIETAMGETIEIDHQRDLYWAEAALREQSANAQPTLTRKAS